MRFFVVLPLLSFFSFRTIAQENPSRPRITQPIAGSNSASNSVVLKGNTHPLARAEFDKGLAPADLPLDRMLLVLKRSPEQDAALQLFLDQQQVKSSPNYHAWLTPEQFAQKFGPNEHDVQIITSWLASQGFKVNRVARGREVIEFSGTAGELKQAFHTEIHKYEVHGEEHWANSSNPQIPAALAPVVAGISTLHNFSRKPLHRIVSRLAHTQNISGNQVIPSSGSLFTTVGSSCGLAGGPCYVVTPYDFATIYNVLPLWNAKSPIDGSGQTIAIVSQTDVYPQDFNDFRQDFGLPAGTLNIIYDGISPGKLASQGDELEADLDMEISGSVAKGATIDLVVSATTNTTAGVDLSALYAVDNNVAPVMSESYGACELEMGAAANLFYNQLWQQAASEGISVFVSTGDSGSAVCDQDVGIATNGLAVNGIASTPYNIAVGGTDFADLSNASLYWGSTNDPTTLASAKSYVPESTWNDTCTNNEYFSFTGDTTTEVQCNDSTTHFTPAFLFPVGGSGGASNCTAPTGTTPSSCVGGYAKPAWQSGLGVPADSKRDLPDVSLFAADGMNSSFYFACETDIYEGCTGEIETMVPLGGTSASSPAFAGIMALINQATQSRQGNANYRLYALAAQAGASCDSGSPASSCIFYDVTGGTIAMPCVTDTPNCVTNNPTDLYGVLSGYSSGSGYDLATGLGSVNVANLVNNWDSVSFTPTVSTLSISPTNIVHGNPVNVSVSVAPQSGTGVPSGMVSLITGNGTPAGTFRLSSGAISSTTSTLPGGSYTVSAHYAGDGTFAASDSSPDIPVTVTPESSTTMLQAVTFDQHGNASTYSTGQYGENAIYVRASVAGQSGQGIPSGTVNLSGTFGYPGNPFQLNVQGDALVRPPLVPSLAYPPGTYTITGSYSGDSSFNSSSGITNFAVVQASTTTVISNIVPCSQSGACSIPTGTSVTIFANTTNPNSPVGNLPTGTITFFLNGVPFGSPVMLDSNIIPPVASINTSQLPPGIDTITAQYSGDMNYTGSTSPATVIGVGQTFTVTANPNAITVSSPGQVGSTTLTFTSQNGFAGTATLSSASCLSVPSESNCSFSPGSVSLSSSNPSATVTLTISTTAPHSKSASSLRSGGRRPYAPWSVFSFLTFSLGLIVITPRFRRGSLLFFALLLIAGGVSCGGGSTSDVGSGTGGSGGGAGGGVSDPGTPIGNQGISIMVVVGGVTQFVNLNVNVQ